MVSPTRKTSERDLNQFNIWMRSQPWFAQWMSTRGLNPSGNGNRKLTRDEQSDLEGVLASHGVPLDSGLHIDSGSSVNQKNRLVKNVAIGAGITGATLLTAGAAGAGPLAGLFGSAAPAVTGTGAGLTAAGNFAASNAAGVVGGLGTTAHALVAPTVAAVAPAAAKAGFSIADAFKTSFAPALNAVTNLAATRAQTSSNDKAAQIQADAIRHAADLQAKAAEEALAFTKGEYFAREGRLAPYRQVGQEAITRVGDLVRPGSGAAYLPPPTQYLPASALVRR